MRRKGEFKWNMIIEYGIVIIFLAAFVIFIVAHLIEIDLTYNQQTTQRQATLLAEELAASYQLIVTNPVPQKGLLNSTKLNTLNHNCPGLGNKFTDASTLYGVTVKDAVNPSNTWSICGSGGDKTQVYPVSIYYPPNPPSSPQAVTNPGIMVITYH